MLRLFNTLGRRMETFQPVNRDAVTIFTCGPSVYQRAHIGNFRTFLFEDVLVRYLEYLGYRVVRGMNFTDIEDKAVREAEKRGLVLDAMTEENIRIFTDEMNLLRIKIPDYLARASETVSDAVGIIEELINKGAAYRHGRNVYFDALTYPRFGALYGIDMSRWPSKKRRFHRDTYRGNRWNLGDFVLWHGCDKGYDVCWDTSLGTGRPAWNIQDAGIMSAHVDETLSIYCGGIDNLIRHHDYTMAILESIRPYPMARFWLHGRHLLVKGKKMSKNRGNIYYTDRLLKEGYSPEEIRFFLIDGHYRTELDFSPENMGDAAGRLRSFGERVALLQAKAGENADADTPAARRIGKVFRDRMDDDLDVKGAFDAVEAHLADILSGKPSRDKAAAVLAGVKEIDTVLQVIF